MHSMFASIVMDLLNGRSVQKYSNTKPRETGHYEKVQDAQDN